MTTAARWRLRHRQALQAPPSDPPSPADRVAALAWAPSTSGIDGAAAAGGEPPQQQAQLAVAVIGSGGRPAVHMFDGEGRRVDRVPLKPAVKVRATLGMWVDPTDKSINSLVYGPISHYFIKFRMGRGTLA